MSADEHAVIVGGGQAGGTLALQLRERGWSGAVTLVTGEPHVPYQRPPLSKAYLSGEWGADRLAVASADKLAEKDIRLLTGTRVTRVEREQRHAALAGGDSLAWDHLALCTGARLRRLEIPGSGLPGIHYLRTRDDSDTLRAALEPGTRLVLVGGGYIGLEVAATARKLGAEVTVVEAAERLMARAVGPDMSVVLQEMHEANGVTVRTGTGVAGFEGGERLEGVRLDNDETLPADVVVIGVGIEPETALAEAAGLDCGDGILIDAQCRTSDPRIHAAGDCTRFPYGSGSMRLESVPSAQAQARVAAAVIAGEDAKLSGAPWFWTEQYGKRIQIAGVRDPAHEVHWRGDRAAGKFGLFYLDADGAVRACEVFGDPRLFMQAKQWVAEGAGLPA